MSAPKVSIILPTWNRLPLLREAVDSVFAQTCAWMRGAAVRLR